MEHSYDDIDDDLNRFCEDMESELDAISGGTGTKVVQEKEPPRSLPKEPVKQENTVAASPWGLSLFSSFASSATKSLSASFTPLANDLSSITSLASSATKAFSDTLSGAPYPTEQQQQQQQQRQQQHPRQHTRSDRDDLTGMAQTPEALDKLRRIQQEHDAHRSEMMYACLLASRSSREVAVPARSVTEVPFTVPPGKEISWKFQVKHYDILFGVKLRVQQSDGSGEWTEHELVPLDRITSEDHIDESCCSERCVRKFIFTLDNNIAMMYSKTVAYDIVVTDDMDWQRQQQEEEQQQQQLKEQQQQQQQQECQSYDQEYQGGTTTDRADRTHTEHHSESVHLHTSEHSHEEHEHTSDMTADVETDRRDEAQEEEWVVYHNDDGQAYFYNNVTNECQWEIPQGFNATDESLVEQPPLVEEEDEEEEDAMPALMLKLSRGFKAGQISAEQRQKFMTDIIECRDLGEVHRDINEILDNWEGGEQTSSPMIV